MKRLSTKWQRNGGFFAEQFFFRPKHLVRAPIKFLVKSEIGIAYRSDHSQVSICLQFNNKKRGKSACKFNNSLLSDFEYINKIKKVIQEVLNGYKLDSPDIETDFVDSTCTFSINYQLFFMENHDHA